MVYFVPNPDAGDVGQPGPPGAVGTGDYGSVYGTALSLGVALVGGAPLVKVPAFPTTGVGNNTTPSGAASNITIGAAGDWVVYYQLTFGYSVGSVCNSQLYVNGVAVPQVRCQHTGTILFHNMGAKGSVTLAAADVLEVRVGAAANGTMTIFDGQLKCRRLS